MKPFTTDVKCCARCGEDHPAVEFKPIVNPPDHTSHYAICPTTGQPILLTIIQTETP